MTSESDMNQWHAIPVDSRYTRRNAGRAMAGYVLRGLVELITNGRDSAIRMEQRGEASREDILRRPLELIKVMKTGRECDFVVRDRFEGMSADTMRKRLLHYGHMASAFDSARGVRGLNARGAKDAGMLGEVCFESIRDGMLTTCRVRLGEFTQPSSAPVTDDERARLDIVDGNGTVVTLSPFPEVRVPTFQTLVRDLERHIEIRYRPSEVCPVALDVSEYRHRGRPKECRITGFAPEGELLLEERIKIPGYAHVPGEARLSLFRSANALRVPGHSLTRLWRSEAGILVGDGRTAHDVSFLGAAGTSDAAAPHLFGNLEVPQIAELLRQFEEYEERRSEDPTLASDPLNPAQVTDPDRLGLNQEHPFVIALIDSVRPLVEEALTQIEEDLRSKTTGGVDKKLRAILEKLGQELAEMLEIDEGPDRGTQIPIGLSFVPPNARIVIGTVKRVGIYFRSSESMTESTACEISTESSSIDIIKQVVKMDPDPDSGVLRGYVEISGIALADTALVAGAALGESAVLRVSVRDEIENPPIELDRDLQFSRTRYSSIPGRKKRIDVYGDPALQGKSVFVTISGDKVHLSPATLHFVFDPDLGVCKAQFMAESTEEANEAVIAVCGDFDDTSRIVYRDLKGRPRINFDFEETASYGGGRRFKWEVAKNRIVIAAEHPTIARVLGPILDSKTGERWPGQHSPQARAVLAEIVAEAFVDRRMQKELPVMSIGVHNLVDPVEYEDQRYSFLEEVLTICHKALTPAYAK